MSALPYTFRADEPTAADQLASLLQNSPSTQAPTGPQPAIADSHLGFASATSLLGALRARELSAGDLVALQTRRIAAYGLSLNAFSSLLPDAHATARAIDAARARGYASILSGLPLTIEQAVQGRTQPTPRLLRKAGATILGYTRGRTHARDGAAGRGSAQATNPWDREHTAGPVSSAAAVAAGLTPLAFGSDAAGQSRLAAAYCGIYAHRPSRPASSRLSQAAEAQPSLYGILARAAADLEVGVQLLGTETSGATASWWLQARPRHEGLAGFRVGLVPAPDDLTLDAEVAAAYEAFVADLRHAGVSAKVLPASMGSVFYARSESQVATDRPEPDKRRETRPLLRELLRDCDILLAPAAATPAPRRGDAAGSPIRASQGFMADDVTSGHPLTVFPIGLTRRLLPIACCAIGPYLEDRTPIRFAALVQEAFGGYHRPPGYAGAS